MKYHLGQRAYWVNDLYTSTDDDSYEHWTFAGNRHILGHSRRDYALSTGVGFDLLKTKRMNTYVQALAGFGQVKGRETEGIDNGKRTAQRPIDHMDYLLSAGLGTDFRLSRHWKVALDYRLRYLGNFDLTHSLGFRVAYVLPKD